MEKYEEKIAYVYPSLRNENEEIRSLCTPQFTYTVNSFPCSEYLLVNFGIANASDGTEYSFDFSVYFDNKPLSEKSEPSAAPLFRTDNVSANGSYIACMVIPTPALEYQKEGLYRLEVRLYRGLYSDESKSHLHTNECFFIVTNEWAY
ncbi:hypothetical protein [Pectobacterium sp. CHL-2024]|uniref:hypothetical protein n=1 Tax=Pectobacterium sp. CHL-2024 TaxID=3377079 RepID=UPI00383B7094